MSEESRKIRVEWKKSDAKRDEGLQEPEDVEQYKNSPTVRILSGIFWMCTAREMRSPMNSR